ncbi:sigma 54-interacting transcriptional regulator [Alicyclobacillus curvatus]|nr:sigma 54-interacting transcriptional regulator [Alicyclobacillus curvatus]
MTSNPQRPLTPPVHSPGFWNVVYTFILSHIDEGIHAIDADGITQVYNRKMAELEAMNPKDVLYLPISDVFRFSENEDSTLLRALREGKSVQNVRQTYFNNTGRAITSVNDTFPLIQDGKVFGAVEIAHDVTSMEQVLQSSLPRPLQFTFERIIGRHPSFLEVLEHARRTARTMSSVLIVGETGTGKELIAQSIHQASPYASGPFISQNCAALPESLIEGLLFGTVRGAFTGAIDRPGLIEQADGGTLLLDELNALSPSLQAKLLRVLQDKLVRRVGATKDKSVNVRVIATINEDPIDAIAANRLRKDVYYRLGVVTLFLPPLRERRSDIPILVEHFIQKYNQLFHLDVKGVDAALLQKFLAYAWPGNVRELEHAIEGAVNLMDEGSIISESVLPFHIRRRLAPEDNGQGSFIQQHGDNNVDPLLSEAAPRQANESSVAENWDMTDMLDTEESTRSGPVAADLHTQLERYERNYIQEVLARSNGNISQAARDLGLSRQNLQYRLRKLNLR